MKRLALFFLFPFSIFLSAQDRPIAVFLGNSITESWPKFDAAFFTDNNFVGRGISGQVSTQIRDRFQTDVAALHPQYVVILAGTNDIAENDGWLMIPGVMQNLDSMCRMAVHAGIQPVLCTLPPSTRYKWRPLLTHEYIRNQILDLNDRIRQYVQKDRFARKHHITLVDYYPLLSDPDGNFIPQYTLDGVHPNLAGYKRMEQALLQAIKR